MVFEGEYLVMRLWSWKGSARGTRPVDFSIPMSPLLEPLRLLGPESLLFTIPTGQAIKDLSSKGVKAHSAKRAKLLTSTDLDSAQKAGLHSDPYTTLKYIWDPATRAAASGPRVDESGTPFERT